jgi:GNAT superfamily N-acetyltransferase
MRSKAQIRRAIPDDLERIVEMGMRFVAETGYQDLIQVRPEKLADTVLSIVTNPDGVVFVSESGDQVTGMIAMLAFDHPYSGTRTASEAVWWVDPEHRGVGLRLLRAAEDWAKENGAKVMQMVAPTEEIGALYARLGFKPIETSYQRSL